MLEDELEAELLRVAKDRPRIGVGLGRPQIAVRVINHAETAADVEMLERDGPAR